VTAVDDQGNPIAGYTGTVHFTSSDSGATLPSDYTFTAADAGVHTFDVILVTAGTQNIIATDTASGITGTASVDVTAATPDHLVVAAPDTVFSGVAFDVTVTVQDAFNNTVISYLGTVQFTSTDSDPGVMLPADYSFTTGDAGQHTFAAGVTLITLGNQTLTVDDPALGISADITVNVTAPAAPPGGRRRTSSSGGPVPQWNGIVQPALSPGPFALLPSMPSSTSALPTSVLDETRITAVFTTTPVRERRLAPLGHRVWGAALALEQEMLFRHDGAGAAWTAFP
jgi:hypothetical protein